MTRDHSHVNADIFRIRARQLFGKLLSLLLVEADVTQIELGEKAIEHREYLVSEQYILSESDTGAVEQSALSRAINGKSALSYSQVYIWLSVLRKIFESDDYLKMCKATDREAYEFTQDLWIDMWHIACFGAPEEVIAAYHRHKWLLKVKSR